MLKIFIGRLNLIKPINHSCRLGIEHVSSNCHQPINPIQFFLHVKIGKMMATTSATLIHIAISIDGDRVGKRLIRMITDYWLEEVRNQNVFTHKNIERSIAAKNIERSIAAKHATKNAAKNAIKKEVTLDHAIPMKELIEKLLTTKDLTAEKVDGLLQQFCVVMVITKEENSLLDAKYKSSMPPNWNGVDIYARYTEVGIKFENNQTHNLL